VQGIAGLLNRNIRGTPPWDPDGGVGSVSSFLAAAQKTKRKMTGVQILIGNINLARNRLGSRWGDFIETIEKNRDSRVSTKLALCQASQESSFLNLEATDSGFTETTVGNAGEIGILQIMPSTAQGLGVDPSQLTDVATNLKTGTRYLGGLISEHKSIAAALRAYKGLGPHAATYANEIIQCAKQVKY